MPRLSAARHGERFVDLGLEPDLIPAAAIRFVDDNGLGGRMYNDLEVGSYLPGTGPTGTRSSRTRASTAIRPAFHATLRRDDLSRADWQAFLDRFGVTTALVSYPDLNPRAALFDPARWALVYRDPDGAGLRGPAFRASRRSSPATRFPMTFTFARGSGVTARALAARPDGSRAGPAIADCDWQKRLGDVFLELGDEAGGARRLCRRSPGPDLSSTPARAWRPPSPAAIWRSRTAMPRRPSRPMPASPSRGCARTAAWRSWRLDGPARPRSI